MPNAYLFAVNWNGLTINKRHQKTGDEICFAPQKNLGVQAASRGGWDLGVTAREIARPLLLNAHFAGGLRRSAGRGFLWPTARRLHVSVETGRGRFAFCLLERVLCLRPLRSGR